MAETLHFDHFLKPKGNLPKNRFPDIDLKEYVEAWIERAREAVDRWYDPEDQYRTPGDSTDFYGLFPGENTTRIDAVLLKAGKNAAPQQRRQAIEAYVYWKAWDHVYERLNAEPKDQTFPDHSASFSDAQIASYKKRRDRWEDEFWDIVTGRDTSGPPNEIRSVSTRTETSF